MSQRVPPFPTTALVFILAAASSMAGDWPKDYVVQKSSESPDGRYVLLVQTADAADAQTSNESNVYLADVKAHTTLGTIEKVDYFEHQNHRGLEIYWAPDSSYCVVENDGRYGMDTLLVLEIKDSKFTQTEIGERIQKSLDSAMKVEGDVSAHFRPGDDRKIRVRATSQNNPKQFENVKTYYALFQGTYDLAAKKWTVTDARRTNSDQDDAFQEAYNDDFTKHMIVAAEDKNVPEDFAGSIFRSEEEKFDALDTQLNQVYLAVRTLLPANRFAKIKQEQILWVKTRGAAKSVEEKSNLTTSRIRALQDLLW
ncbi:MAG TPA: hypothetical protein VLK27_11330 [Chthoniobacterales bacterium]|nr:hypothetical protein [Chthoniobacterales bacterium]